MERDAVARAVRPLATELTSFARWLVGSGEEADELVQEVVVRALESADSIQDPTRLRAWLFRTMRNARIDRLRAAASRSRLMVIEGGADEEGGALMPASPLSSIVARVDVERGLAQLSESARVILLLSDLWQFSYDEIAAIVEIPIGTVRSRISRSRAQLAQFLLADGVTRRSGGDGHG